MTPSINSAPQHAHVNHIMMLAPPYLQTSFCEGVISNSDLPFFVPTPHYSVYHHTDPFIYTLAILSMLDV